MNSVNRLPLISILANIQVLVVDNNCDSGLLYTYLLKDFGAIINIAYSVEEAVEILNRLTPDIVICELRFWRESVCTLTQKLRELGANNGRHIPVIAATASYVTNDALGQFLESGFDGYLLKPFDLDKFVSTVESLVCIDLQAQTAKLSTNAAFPVGADLDWYSCKVATICRCYLANSSL